MESLAYASLPLLVADLADEESRDFLEGVALAEQVAFVPLLVAPADRSTHALEVYSPASREPLRLLADPVGPPTKDGFPLRLRVKHHTQEPVRAPSSQKKRPTTLRARHETNHELTARHSHDLEEPTKENREPVSIIGRAIAGGKLQIDSLIGGGGVGAVYRAQHRELRMPVAVKVLHESYQREADFGRRFHAEALAASRLDHPNVTRVLDFGQEPDGMLYLVMEYLDGMSLRTLLERERRFGTERIVKILSQVCGGLAHAHARSIIHKDVKPENLIILSGSDDDGVPMEIVKVCDFGIAQGALAEETRRFQGTPEYMSPEQCMSETLDARSDVYSCGVVLYELATGEVPFTDDEVGHIVWRHLNETPIPPSKRAPVDPRVEQIILRALAKNKEERYASMRDLRAALRNLLEKPPATLSGQFARVVVPSQSPSSSARPRPSASAPRSGSPSSSRMEAVATNEPSHLDVAPSSQRGSEHRAPAPSWLIHGGSYELATTTTASGAPLSPRSELLTDPIAFMRRLVGTTDPRTFAEIVNPLEETIRELVESLQVDTLWRLASTLDILATEGPAIPGSRAATSKAMLHLLRDPSVLAPIAQRVLAVGDATGERLLTAAGSFGAHALYSARVRQGDAEARRRFINAIRAIGPSAMPILRGGLDRLADRLNAPGAPQIAEDLLYSLPALHDEALGGLVAAYARSNSGTLARAAVQALPGVWHERARSVILGLLEHPDPKVTVAALGSLGELGITDEHTPKRLAQIFDRSDQRSVRLAIIRAMVQTRGDARRLGVELLQERLRLARFLQTTDEVEIGIHLARTLLTIGDDPAAMKALVDECSLDWPKDVRAKMSEATP